MGMLRSPSQTELIQQAMPTLPPPPPPVTQYMAGMAAGYNNPQMSGVAQGLSATQAYLDPNNAGAAFSQQRMHSAGQTLGSGLSTASLAAGFIPGGQVAAAGVGMFSDTIGDWAANNPLTRGIHGAYYGQAGQSLSTMANLQHGTAGALQMTGGSSGLRGTGMSTTGAMQLGRRFQGMGEQWAKRNPERAEQAGGGDADLGIQRYTQDMTKLTQMAGDSGLLDAATNIDQIGTTVQKLFKVLGAMGKITGDPDFKNNLRELASMRQSGYSLDQAVTATRDIQRFARGMGMSREHMMATGGAMGQQAFAQAGLAGGMGGVYGAHAQLQSRQLAGTFSPMQSALLGGQEGIAGRFAQQQAHFASGPMSMMLGAALTTGPEGQLGVDASKMGGLFANGGTLSGAAGQSSVNLMKVARQMAADQGITQQDALAQIQMKMQTGELASTAAQQLGPTGMKMLQMNTVASLAKQTGSLTAAAYSVAGGDSKQAQMMMGMMTSPEAYSRERERLQRDIDDLKSSARRESEVMREDRQRIRDENTAGLFGYRAIGRALSTVADATVGGFIRDFTDPHDRGNKRAADVAARELQRNEDRARGVTAAYFTGRGPNEKIVRERIEKMRTAGELDTETGDGARRFEAMRSRIEKDEDYAAEMSVEQFEAADLAEGSKSSIVRGFRSLKIEYSDNAQTDALRRRAKGKMLRTLETAQVILDTQGEGIREYATSMRSLSNQMEKKGLKGSKTAYNVEKAVIAYASKVGTEGGAVQPDKMLATIQQALLDSGMKPADVKKAMRGQNKAYWMKHAVRAIKSRGTETAQAALGETVDLASQMEQEDIDRYQENIDDAQEEYREAMEEAGIVDDDEFSVAEEEALGGLKDVSDPAVQEYMMLSEMARDEDLSEEARDEAGARLAEITEKEGSWKTIQKAESVMKGIRAAGGDTKVVGKVGAMLQKKLGGVEGIAEEMRKGRAGEGGAADILFKEERAVTAALKKGLQYRGGKVVAPGRDTGSADTEKQITVAEKQLDNLNDMQKQFARFGTATTTLQSAADQLKSAAAVLKGGRAEETLVKWNALLPPYMQPKGT